MNAADHIILRENLEASMRRSDIAQAAADQASIVVLDRDREISQLNDKIERLISGCVEANDLRVNALFERDLHMKRCDELVRLGRDSEEATSRRIEYLKSEIEDALLVVQEQSRDIVGLVKAVSRAEREVQELRSRRVKEV